MGRRKSGDEDAPSVGIWMVSFSDCMTNLLTFFVLLCSFSSFDEESLERFSGVFDSMSVYSIFPSQEKRNEARFEPLERPIEFTPEGSEAPTYREPGLTLRPRQVGWTADRDAYSDRRVLVIPLQTMFVGRSSHLRDEGKRFLDLLAELLMRLPCHVVIDETFPPGQEPTESIAVDQAYAAMSYLRRPELASSSFSLAAAQVSDSPRLSQQPMLRITLLNRSFYQ